MSLPDPESRKESYLAKAAGMDVGIPEYPESRLEQYLEAIANGGGGGGGSKPTFETYSVAAADWSALADSSPYNNKAVVTATYSIGADTIVELINNNAVLFANYGFGIGAINGQNITIYAIGKPENSVSLTIGYQG